MLEGHAYVVGFDLGILTRRRRPAVASPHELRQKPRQQGHRQRDKGEISLAGDGNSLTNGGKVLSAQSKAIEFTDAGNSLTLLAPSFLGGGIDLGGGTTVKLMTGPSHSVLWEFSEGTTDGGVPVIVTQGDLDEAVPATNTRMWIESMEAVGLDHEYVEISGAGHGDVIDLGMDEIFSFFEQHTK